MKNLFRLRYLAMAVGLLSLTACLPMCDSDNVTPGSRLASVPYQGVNSSQVDCHIYALPEAMSDGNRVNAGQTRGPLYTSLIDFSITPSATLHFRASNPGGQLAEGTLMTTYTDLIQQKSYRVEYDGTQTLKITEQ